MRSKSINKFIAAAMAAVLAAFSLTACSSATKAPTETPAETEAVTEAEISEAVDKLSDKYSIIELTTAEGEDGSVSHTAEIDGQTVPEFDYTWHCDPAGTYDECDDAPAEYFTGTEPVGAEIYVAHDIYYYPQIDASKFEKVNYDGETEWVTYYQSEEYSDYIFGTLPVKGQNIPENMMHTADEAYENAVLHINMAGTYKLTGEWRGQIYIDLGEDAYDDPNAVVTLILDDADIECTVAPGVIFKSVYECDSDWEDREEQRPGMDTSAAGANIIIADGSENSISGTNIYRMLKTKLKDEDSVDAVPVQKKIRKNDGALYSYMSMNIYGEDKDSGILTVSSENEGIDSELHLTINGGIINIYSQDDGINTNEDGVSVTTINGGDIRIAAGLGYEGDGIDSNGFLVINGGKVVSLANPAADSGLDSDCGSYICGGDVLALGSTMDWVEGDTAANSAAVTMNLQFAQAENANEMIEVMDEAGNIVFAYNQSEDPRVSDYQRYFTGAIISCPDMKMGETYTVWIGGKQQAYIGTELGGPGHGGMPQQMGDGKQPPEIPDGAAPTENGSGKQPPQMQEGQQPPQMNEGETPPEIPDGNTPPEMGDGKQPPEMKDGQQPPQMQEGGTPPEMPDGNTPTETGDGKQPPEMKDGQQPPQIPQDMVQASEPISDFTMENSVNCFSGVTDL